MQYKLIGRMKNNGATYESSWYSMGDGTTLQCNYFSICNLVDDIKVILKGGEADAKDNKRVYQR